MMFTTQIRAAMMARRPISKCLVNHMEEAGWTLSRAFMSASGDGKPLTRAQHDAMRQGRFNTPPATAIFLAQFGCASISAIILNIHGPERRSSMYRPFKIRVVYAPSNDQAARAAMDITIGRQGVGGVTEGQVEFFDDIEVGEDEDAVARHTAELTKDVDVKAIVRSALPNTNDFCAALFHLVFEDIKPYLAR